MWNKVLYCCWFLPKCFTGFMHRFIIIGFKEVHIRSDSREESYSLLTNLPGLRCRLQSGNRCIYKDGSSECRASGRHCRGQNSRPGSKQGQDTVQNCSETKAEEAEIMWLRDWILCFQMHLHSFHARVWKTQFIGHFKCQTEVWSEMTKPEDNGSLSDASSLKCCISVPFWMAATLLQHLGSCYHWGQRLCGTLLPC